MISGSVWSGVDPGWCLHFSSAQCSAVPSPDSTGKAHPLLKPHKVPPQSIHPSGALYLQIAPCSESIPAAMPPLQQLLCKIYLSCYGINLPGLNFWVWVVYIGMIFVQFLLQSSVSDWSHTVIEVKTYKVLPSLPPASFISTNQVKAVFVLQDVKWYNLT